MPNATRGTDEPPVNASEPPVEPVGVERTFVTHSGHGYTVVVVWPGTVVVVSPTTVVTLCPRTVVVVVPGG